VNHIDELYIADLSEKSNENANWLSMLFAAASLTLTILILPSFWADIMQAFESKYQHLLPGLESFGNGLAIFLFGTAVFLFIFALLRLMRVRKGSRRKSKIL
jgi:preprotein translocase subunit SecG